MEYQKYIDLGFERHEMSCGVEFKQTGYSGFALEKKVNKRQMCSLYPIRYDKSFINQYYTR